MLTKETKKIAETIAEELRPNFEEIKRLGAKIQRANTEYYKARETANAWTWKKTPESQKLAGEDVHKWGEIMDANYKTENEKENAHTVARFNYEMALNETAQKLGELVRPFIHLLEPRQGLHSLTDYINNIYSPNGCEYSPKYARVWFGGCISFINEFSYSVTCCALGACGLSSSADVYYKRYEQEQPKEIKTRQRLTVAQYCRIIEKLKQNQEKAEKLEKEAREIGGDLLYFGNVKAWHIVKD